MGWKNVSLSKLIKTKEELNQTELDGKIRTNQNWIKTKGNSFYLCSMKKKDST